MLKEFIMPKDEIPRGQLSCVILSTLKEQDKYGYEIIDEVLKNSQGKISIKQPSLYSSLKRMEEQSLISSYWRDSDIGGKRHYYHLTDLGKKHLEKWQADYEDIYYIKNSNQIENITQQNEESLEPIAQIDNHTEQSPTHLLENLALSETDNNQQATDENQQINNDALPEQRISSSKPNQQQEKADDGVFITERLSPEDIPKQPKIESRRFEMYVSGGSVAPDLKRSKAPNYEDRVKDLYEKSKSNAENQELEIIDDVVKFATYKDLQNFYAEQNIKFKPYQKLLKKTEKDYNMVRITKLNMITCLLTFVYICLLSLGFGIGFSFSNVARLNRPFVFIICPILALILFAISYIIYLKSPQKRVALDLTKFKLNFKLAITSILLIPIVIALNIFIGFNFSNFARYSLTITYPCVIALTYFVFHIIRKIILKFSFVY